MPDDRGRTAADREAARRERANRRARREGRPLPYDETYVDPPAAEPPAAEPPAAEPPAAEPPVSDAPPAASAEPVPPIDAPATPPEPDSEPVVLHPIEPDPEPEPEREPDPVPAVEATPTPAPPSTPEQATAEHDTLAPEEPLITPREDGAAARPIKSFPSPPDPEFYVPDDQLETPSGTRRVSRGSVGSPRTAARRPVRTRRPPVSPARRRSPWRRWLGRAFALLVLLVAAAVVWLAIEVFQPFGTSPHGKVTVTIPSDTGANGVGRILARDGVVGSATLFDIRATLNGDRGSIHAGTYHLQKGMGYGAVLSVLTAKAPAAKSSQLTIDEGHTRQYIAQLLRKQHIRGSYLAASRRSKLLNPRSYGAPKSTDTLEGFLFPDTFRLRDPITASALVADQLKDFKRRFRSVDLAYARRHGLSAFDVVTIASLIEGESATAHDDRLVSSVIYNRLRDHMMLQLDSTTRYATGNFTAPLTVGQLHSSSPYNTRTHVGLPPGPINSPGLTALRAAAQPANSQFLYFFTKPCTSTNVFARSFGAFEELLIRDHRSHCPKR